MIKIIIGIIFIFYSVICAYMTYGAYWSKEKRATVICAAVSLLCFLIGLKLIGWLPK